MTLHTKIFIGISAFALVALLIVSVFLLRPYLAGYGASPIDTTPPANVTPGDAAQGLPLELLSVPEGFTITTFARVPHARSLAVSADDTVFVSTRTDDKVYALRDADADGIAEQRHVVASGLDTPNGIALLAGDLYVAEPTRILRYADIESQLSEPPAPTVISDALPNEQGHEWRYMRAGPDSRLYIGIGAPCNNCNRGEPFASIISMDPDGSDLGTYANGIRNTVGFDWDADGELWFTDNGRDWLGNDAPGDELNHAPTQGMHFGYPYCHAGTIADPEFGDERSCDEFTPPAHVLGPHVAALGMRFYSGEQFPQQYHNDAFIAEHGSWNRDVPIGYRVMRVPIEDGAAADYDVFIEGWLIDGESWGRPVDVAIRADGSLLVSDDKAGAVYLVTYTG